MRGTGPFRQSITIRDRGQYQNTREMGLAPLDWSPYGRGTRPFTLSSGIPSDPTDEARPDTHVSGRASFHRDGMGSYRPYSGHGLLPGLALSAILLAGLPDQPYRL